MRAIVSIECLLGCDYLVAKKNRIGIVSRSKWPVFLTTELLCYLYISQSMLVQYLVRNFGPSQIYCGYQFKLAREISCTVQPGLPTPTSD